MRNRKRIGKGQGVVKSYLTLDCLESRRLLSWTMMAYMAADSNLEEFMLDDFLEMGKLGSDEQVNLVVQLDRAAGEDSRFGNWTDTRRGLVNRGDTPSKIWGQSVGEVDYSRPETLANFLEWGMAAYPADHYALLFSGHGEGYGGVCFDDTSEGNGLTMGSLRTALEGVLAGNEKLDMVCFDACLMSMVEVGYEMSDYFDVMVASQELVPGTGWVYDQWLEDLKQNPQAQAGEVGTYIVNTYRKEYDRQGEVTLSVVDLEKLAGTLTEALDGFAGLMLESGTAADWLAFEAVAGALRPYGSDEGGSGLPFRDIGGMMTALTGRQGVSGFIAGAANTVLAALNDTVLTQYASEDREAAGVSIYLPGPGDDSVSVAYDSGLRFATATRWDELIGGAAPQDPQEPDPVDEPDDGGGEGDPDDGDPAGNGFTIESVAFYEEAATCEYNYLTIEMAASGVGTITALIDWGDGSEPDYQELEASEGAATLRSGYDYWEPGDYGVSIVLTDDLGQTQTLERTVTVDYIVERTEVDEYGEMDTLAVGGTPGADSITIKELKTGELSITIKGVVKNYLYTPDYDFYEVAVSGGAGNDTINAAKVTGYYTTLDGGDGNDKLTGGKRCNLIFGGGGNDTIKGSDDDDFLFGEEGDDKIYGGKGDDKLYGDAGNDMLYGNDGDDYLDGGDGDDVLFGHKGDNTVEGGAGYNTIKYRDFRREPGILDLLAGWRPGRWLW